MKKFFAIFFVAGFLFACGQQNNSKTEELLNQDQLHIVDGKYLLDNQYVKAVGFYTGNRLTKIYVFDKDAALQLKVVKEGFYHYGEKLFDLILKEGHQFTFGYDDTSFSLCIVDEKNNEAADNLVFLLDRQTGKYEWPVRD